MSDDFKATFWGVRGSYPVPGKDTVYFGGRTTCIEIKVSNVTIIVDAGTGIIPLGNAATENHFKENPDAPLELTVLFTHLHHDHTQGLPFFTPLYLGQSRLHFFGPLNFDSELQTVLERSMTPPNFPIDLRSSNSIKQFSTIGEQNLILFHLPETTPILVNRFQDTYEITKKTAVIRVMTDFSHPANGVLVYRIDYGGKSLVFATDVEGYLYGNAKLIHFAQGADLLIHDAQYSAEQYTALPTPRQGFGHSVPEMAIEVGKKAGVKNLVLTHHDPTATDAQLKKIFTKYKRRFPALLMAREGLTIHLN